MADWKKEIRVSDLFKKKGKKDVAKPDTGAAPSVPASDAAGAQPSSFLKKEFSLGDRFKKRHAAEAPTAPPEQPAVPSASTVPADPSDPPVWSTPATPPEPAGAPAPAEATADELTYPSFATPAPEPTGSAPTPHAVDPPASPVAPETVPGVPTPSATPAAPAPDLTASAAPDLTAPVSPPPGLAAPEVPGVQPPETSATPVSPETQPAAEAATAVAEAAQGNVWKRELKASDLLKKMGWSNTAKTPRGGKASDKRTPRPEDVPQPDSPAVVAGEGSVWKRELRASDLFKRREPAPSVPADAFSETGSEPVSFWKKELSLQDLLRKKGEQGGAPSAAAQTAPTPTAPAPTPTSTPEGAPSEVPSPASAPTPGTAPEPKESEDKKDKKGKVGKTKKAKGAKPGLPKLDLNFGSLLGKKGGSNSGPATKPIAIPLTRAVNLLPPDLVQKRQQKFGLPEIGVAVAGLLVVVGLFVMFTGASGRVSDAETQVTALEGELQTLQEAASAIAGAGGGADPLLGEEGVRATALSTALESRTAWDRVLRRVAVVMPADTWLRGLGGTSTTSDLALSVGAGAELASTLTLTGFALSRDGVAQLLSRMDTIPELASVQLLAATATDIGGKDVVEFSITATLEDSFQPAVAVAPIGVTP